ncbi:MAG: hypothetical protein WCI73_06490 [Phycisphaerae bacterium]
MKTSFLRTLSIAAIVISPLALAVGCAQNGAVGSSHQVSHTESDKTGWFGGQTHEANTVYKNSDGSTSIDTETTTSKNGTTTIVRDRKTTNLDGSVKTDRETRTIVKGSDNVVSESKTVN